MMDKKATVETSRTSKHEKLRAREREREKEGREMTEIQKVHLIGLLG